jgi:soluble lytic murein transglycosylase-like protein
MTVRALLRSLRAPACPRQGLLFGLACLLCCSAAGAADMQVYVAYSKRGMPIVTDVPLPGSAKLVFAQRPPAARPAATSFASWRPTPLPKPTAATGPAAARREALLPHVREAARRHRLDEALLMALIEVESGFRADALSPAGAIGLMQLMPQTARRFGVADPWQPLANLDGGARYLRHLLGLFDGDLRLALAGYNAGEGSVLAAGRRIPPFKETQAYVPAVLDRLRHWRGVLQESPQ